MIDEEQNEISMLQDYLPQLESQSSLPLLFLENINNNYSILQYVSSTFTTIVGVYLSV